MAGQRSSIRLHRNDSSNGEERSRSDSSLLGANPTQMSMMSTHSERSLVSESEKSELHDNFQVDADSFNAVALSKPIINPAARRRPSQVTNLASMIPAENKLQAKDLLGDEAPSNKRPQDVALGTPPKALSVTEQWLADKLVQLEKEYLTRIQLLEQECSILREALVAAKITVPPKPVPAPVSASSTPSMSTEKKSISSPQSPGSPLAKKPPPMPVSSPRVPNRRPSSTEVPATSPRAPLRRDASGDMVSESSSSPLAAKVSSQVFEEPPLIQQASAKDVVDESNMKEDESVSKDAESLKDSEIETSVEAPNAIEATPADEDEDDVDDDLKDML